MSLWVCVDASVLLKLVVAEPDSELADALWRSWIRERKLPVAPPLAAFRDNIGIEKARLSGDFASRRG